MTKPADDLLFAIVNTLPTLDKVTAAKEILSLDDSLSWWDDYRYTKMFPLMTKHGQIGKYGTRNVESGDFQWVDHAPKVLVDWFEDYVFPWAGEKSRVMALVTQPGISNHEHIDCQRHELNTRQHKFRIVLQGKTSTLYWVTSNGRVYAPEVEQAFIIDGGWPHGMINSTDEIKITIAMGAPWEGLDELSDLTLLQRRSNFTMPADIEKLWKS
jgi:hypothetical protein